MHTLIKVSHAEVRHPRDRERGVALVFAVFTSALVTGASNSRAATNYRAASQVHFVAESGLSDAIANINATGVINYQTDVVNAWGTRYGTGAKTFAPLAGYSYTVATTIGASAQNYGVLVATATGPEGVKNV